jgi:hypothetical protein
VAIKLSKIAKDNINLGVLFVAFMDLHRVQGHFEYNESTFYLDAFTDRTRALMDDNRIPFYLRNSLSCRSYSRVRFVRDHCYNISYAYDRKKKRHEAILFDLTQLISNTCVTKEILLLCPHLLQNI